MGELDKKGGDELYVGFGETYDPDDDSDDTDNDDNNHSKDPQSIEIIKNDNDNLKSTIESPRLFPPQGNDGIDGWNRNMNNERRRSSSSFEVDLLPSDNSYVSSTRIVSPRKCHNRMHARDFLSSSEYVPTEEEGREVKDLANELGIRDPKTGPLSGMRSSSGKPFVYSLLHPFEKEKRSVLLKRGTVVAHCSFVKGERQAASSGVKGLTREAPRITNQGNDDNNKELILLTNGFVIVSKIKNILSVNKNRIDACEDLSSVSAILDLNLCSLDSLRVHHHDTDTSGGAETYIPSIIGTDEQDAPASSCTSNPPRQHDERAFCILLDTNTTLTLRCSSVDEKLAWIDVMSVSVIGAQQRAGKVDTGVVGWKHRIMRTSIHSAALLGDDIMLKKILLKVNADEAALPDESGYSAAHYAVMKRHNLCLSILLDAGADPNAADINMMTPLDYASAEGNTEALELLQRHEGLGKTVQDVGEEHDFEEPEKSVEDSELVEDGRIADSTETKCKVNITVNCKTKKNRKRFALKFIKKKSSSSLVDGGDSCNPGSCEPTLEHGVNDCGGFALKTVDTETSNVTVGQFESVVEEKAIKTDNSEVIWPASDSEEEVGGDAHVSLLPDSDSVKKDQKETSPISDSLSPADGLVTEALPAVDMNFIRGVIYDPDYVPNEEEDAEVKRLAFQLGVGDRNLTMSKSRAPVVALFYPFDGERRSILLQRGKVRVKQISLMKASVWSETADDRELILLTQAFLVADRTTARGTNNLLNAAAKLMRSNVEDCVYLKDILAVIDINLCSASSRIVDTCRVVPIDEGNDEADCHECALQICTESKRLMFLFPSKIEKASWITALTSSIVGIKSRLAEAESHATGWTHRIMKTSMHSAAFLGDVEMLKKVLEIETLVDIADPTGYTAAHYAAMSGNDACLAVLLNNDADPNQRDVNLMSPVDYAYRNRHQKALEVLDAYGGQLNQNAREWLEGELEIARWERRILKIDVYDNAYVLNDEEEEEVRDLAKDLGVSGKRQFVKKKGDSLFSILYPSVEEPRAVLLKRGTVTLRSGNSEKSTGKSKELVLLTSGFIVISGTESSSPLIRKGKKLLYSTTNFKKEKWSPLTDISAVMDLEYGAHQTVDKNSVDENEDVCSDEENSENDEINMEAAYDDSAFKIVLSDRSYTFSCATKSQKVAWLGGFEAAITNARLKADTEETKKLGWKHRIMRCSIYSAAICGDADMLYKIVSTKLKGHIDMTDDAGYAASHYAAMNGNDDCLAILLDNGADPDEMDADMLSPVDYASRLRNRRALEMLEADGGNICSEDKDWMEEEVSGGIGSIVSEPASGGGVMTETMAAMSERGERLRQLQNRTSNLTDVAAAYKERAAQLKQKSKSEGKLFRLKL